MEYLVGSLVTFVLVVCANRFLSRKKSMLRLPPIRYSQSMMHILLLPILPTNSELAQESSKNTQSKNHYAKTSTRILFIKKKAYWIQNNRFYTAEANKGIVDENTAKEVDIMAMDRVQLREMAYIVEKLTEGIKDEGGDPGK